ncbi:MAG TPA: TetR/AcrR family transcriptional regulator C-terminal domain-containing protein [Gaiellaceae bacterium]|nr:TetR/AcrR family transcriptional regulator C-terminal domain-containing protein [Gaiellaceae bacterium]
MSAQLAQPREPLNRRRILEAALALVDREGAGALSMRRLGRELGVEAMSLYNHVSGRDAILDGLSEVMVARIGLPPAPARWEEALGRFMHGIREIAAVHPAAFQVVGMRPLNSPEALPQVETLLKALRAGGFDPVAASQAYRLAASYARGFALAEIRGFTLDAPGGRLRAADVRADDLPTVADLADSLSGFDRDAAFAYGVDTILAGIAATRAASRTARRPRTARSAPA